MHTGAFRSALQFHRIGFILSACVLLASITALATHSSHAAPQAKCPSQADCDHLKAISDLAAADAFAAKAVADQAEADRQKDLAAADQLERDASHPDPESYPRASDRVGYGQAKRAQAKALRDKLENAKANADARAKAAAAAAKAYQDCLDGMKPCPPTNSATQTGATTNSTASNSTSTVNGATAAVPRTATPTRGGGRRGSSLTVEVKDTTTTDTVIPSLGVAVYLGNHWNGTDWTFRKEDFRLGTNYGYTPSQGTYGSQPTDGGVGWRSNVHILQIPPISNIGQSGLGDLPLTGSLTPDGSLTLGQTPGGFGLGGSALGYGSNGYFPLNGLNPPLNFSGVNPTGPSGAADAPGGLQIPRAPRFFLQDSLRSILRPQSYYDDGSQYFGVFDGFGSPHYCAFDFPDSLRTFPEISHALAVEEASRRRRENQPPREQTDGQLQLTSFHTPSPSSEFAGSAARARQNRDQFQQTAPSSFTYSIVSNGKSTGEAFQLQLLDTTGKVKSVRMRSGTVLEAIKKGVTQPVTENAGGKVVTQPLNGFCLQFGKQPPAQGTLYRMADESVQQKYSPMRFIARASEQMGQNKAFHPDSDPKAYTDAILQYALWSELEGWNQEKFTQHFVERTKENADALHVKWTNEMENALRAAAPGRWKDISEMLQEAQVLEKDSGQGRGRGGRRGGGRGGRRGAVGSDR
jgi:hypothetical protein